MTDSFSGHHAGLDAPATHAFSIAPANGTDLAAVTRAIYAGTGGNIALVMLSGQTATFANIAAGTILPVRATRVLQTGTTALDLVGLC